MKDNRNKILWIFQKVSAYVYYETVETFLLNLQTRQGAEGHI